MYISFLINVPMFYVSVCVFMFTYFSSFNLFIGNNVFIV